MAKKKIKRKHKSTPKPDKSDTIKKGTSRDRTVEKQNLFLQLYKTKACNVSVTCSAVGISRETYYDWIKKYPNFVKACNDAEESMIDRAETRLIEQIDDGNMTAIIFFLCNKGKKRGWSNRHTLEGGDGDKPIRVIMQGVNVSKYPNPEGTE